MEKAERQRLVVLGCILGLLLAVFAAKTFFVGDSGGGGANDSVVTPKSGADVPAAKAKAATAKQKSAAAKKTVAKAKTTVHKAKAAPASTPPSTFQVYATRNPFEPVIQVETTTPPSGGSSGGSTSTTTPSSGGSSSGGTTETTVPSNEPPPGTTVTLLSVYHDSSGTVKAKVQVGSTVYTVGVGDTFANGQYRVVSLDPPCGQFLFGDSPFRLCEGEQTIK